MSAAERERIYDEEIAPVLLELAKKCEAAGLSMIAAVEWAPNEYGETAFLPAGPRSASMMLIHAAVKAHGNVDSLFIAARRHADQFGHGSVVLQLMEASR